MSHKTYLNIAKQLSVLFVSLLCTILILFIINSIKFYTTIIILLVLLFVLFTIINALFIKSLCLLESEIDNNLSV
jgi:hypothetical protein